jgi:dTMP kinase
MFIAIEGIDGSGKGTQAKLLNKWLKEKGYETFLTKEPTTGVIGRLLREALKEGGLDSKTEALLFAADRAEHVKEILPKLEEGRVVITERYLLSSMAYQGASGVSMEWVKEVNRFAPSPDIVLLLDVSPEVGLKRITFREKEYFERREFLSKVREIYLDLEKDHKNIIKIDASGSIEDVQTAIRRKIGRILSTWEEVKKKPTQKRLKEYFG